MKASMSVGLVMGFTVGLAWLVAPGRSMAQASLDAERDAVLAVVQSFFDTMAAKDATTARQILLPEGRFYAVGDQTSKVRIRAFTVEEYLFDLPAMKQSVRERFWNPEVRIRGFIANVWTPYDFWTNGRLSHCGIDSFDLIKTEQGWKIAGGTYTIESKCATSPLGTLKK
jgi:hypothetical protein